MGGHDALKSHPFFAGINWERVKRQEEPVPAYNVVMDPEDSSRILQFRLHPDTDLNATNGTVNGPTELVGGPQRPDMALTVVT